MFIVMVKCSISASGWKLPIFLPHITRDHLWNSFSNQTAAVSRMNINAHWKFMNQLNMHSPAEWEPRLIINSILRGQVFFLNSICRARVKATLCQLLSPFGQVILKGLKGLLRTLTLFILPFSAVLCNSFWVQIFLSILLRSAFYR